MDFKTTSWRRSLALFRQPVVVFASERDVLKRSLVCGAILGGHAQNAVGVDIQCELEFATALGHS